LNYLFSISLVSGDKTFLAGCAGLENEEKVVEKAEESMQSEYDRWRKNVRYASCHIKGYKSTPLYGQVFLQNDFTDKWVLVVHGYGGDGNTMNCAVKRFHDEGFNVVLPDLRSHGLSGGKYIGMGWLDRMDILEWCDKIIKGNPDAKIVLYGVSMGAAAVLMAASEDIPQNIACAISDCSFDSVGGIIARQIKRVMKLPPQGIVACLDLMCRHRAGYHIINHSVTKRVKNIKIPTMFIHGDKDELVDVKSVYKLFESANCKKDVLIVPEAGHGVCAMVGKDFYWKRVFDFVQLALKN
jgi:hypothetical protein